MVIVKIADLKNNLSRHLARVRQGGEITVYDRDTPVARIVPFVQAEASSRRKTGKDAAASAGRVAELVRQGVLSHADPDGLAAWMAAHEPIRRPAGTPSALDTLLALRRESTR